ADLDSWKATQLAAYWGHKSALVAMDVGMLVGGISSCGTSYALYKAGEITAEQLALRAGHGALRAVLGASGVFLNSAAAHTDPFWREVSKYRGYTIIADVGLGTAMSVGNKVLGLSETAEAKAFHDAVKATMDQAHPVWKGLYYFTEGASPFQPGMHNLYHWPMMLSQGYFGVTVSHDIWNQMDAIAHSQEENPYLDALIKIQGGRDVSTLPDNVQALLGVHQNKEMTATLDFYKKCLIEGEDVSSARAREITSMFDRCREIVLRQPPEDAQQADLKRFEEQRGGDIEKLKSELLVHVFGDGSKVADEIAAAEKNKTRSPDAAVKKLTVGGLDQKSKVAALVAIFMMTAASQKSGLRDDQVISQRKVQLPSHPVLEYRGEEYDVEARRPPRPIWVTVEDKRSVRQELTVADLEEMLKPTLHKGNPQERFVTANVLTMSGERNQFALAGTLCTLLNDKNANSATKSCVLTELSLITGAIKHTEATTGAQQLSEYQAESWGLSSKGLEQVLSSFAGDPSNDRRLRLL
ncbi:MAG: hypothetical protein K2Z81_26320, partial [Cyanobacteria bacterium]|nr:hypothetical protein [Cyanobacteriota bacterium]